MKKLIREPLVHFVVLGILIFVVSASLERDAADPQDIVVSLALQENLARTFARTWRRAPEPEELQSLVADYVREQIAYRESKKLGLDEDDVIIRRRMRQKFELLTEELATLAPPTEEELQAWLDDHAEDYRAPSTSTLQHIYFSVDASPSEAKARAEALLARLQADESAVDIGAAGDRSMLPSRLEGVSDRQLLSSFGGAIATALDDIEPGQWSGPVESGFGLHLIKLESREPGQIRPLSEVGDSVAYEWAAARKQQAIDALYERLAEGYTIEIEQAAGNPTP